MGSTYKGNDRALIGFILGLLGFWLFAQTMLNINVEMGKQLSISSSVLNLAVAAAALFSGLFVVVAGNLADRFGRVRILRWGYLFGVIGGGLVACTMPGRLAVPLLIAGRIFQGLSIACIMPSSLALVKVYWSGAARQRAVSLWSMGTWGGAGFSSLLGGFLLASIGWRAIFGLAVLGCVLGYFLTRDIPESKEEHRGGQGMDWLGLVIFIVTIFSLQLVATQGSSWGWTSWLTIMLLALAVVGVVWFVFAEKRATRPFVDINLFRNGTYLGATLSNFILNAVAGILIVSLNLMQMAAGASAATAGCLTIGYAVAIVLLIRMGERLLRRFGPRRPMVWGCLIVCVSIVLLMNTHVMSDTYMVLAAIAYTLFGVGLAFYATPSTDAALGNLPLAQAGAGAGIYKMASSLGAAFGVAISSTIYTSLNMRVSPSSMLDEVITFVGRQDNVVLRDSAFWALLFNLVCVLLAVVVIFLTVPKGKKVEVKS